jgi:hypothetical protein
MEMGRYPSAMKIVFFSSWKLLQKDQFQMNMLHNPIFNPKLEINNLQKKDWVLLNVLFNIHI